MERAEKNAHVGHSDVSAALGVVLRGQLLLLNVVRRLVATRGVMQVALGGVHVGNLTRK